MTEAYSVLSDPEKKKLYDQFGNAAFDQSGAAGSGYGNAGTGGFGGFGGNGGFRGGTYRSYGGPGSGYQEYHFEGGDMDDMFGDIFGNMFHGGSTSGRSRRTSGFTGGFGGESFKSKGSDIKAGITVGFDEAAFGGDKVITLSNPENPGQPGQSLKVHIPAGIDSGKSIRLRGKGMPGTGGGEAGDLLLWISSEKTGMNSSRWQRKARSLKSISHIRTGSSASALTGSSVIWLNTVQRSLSSTTRTSARNAR